MGCRHSVKQKERSDDSMFSEPQKARTKLVSTRQHSRIQSSDNVVVGVNVSWGNWDSETAAANTHDRGHVFETVGIEATQLDVIDHLDAQGISSWGSGSSGLQKDEKNGKRRNSKMDSLSIPFSLDMEGGGLWGEALVSQDVDRKVSSLYREKWKFRRKEGSDTRQLSADDDVIFSVEKRLLVEALYEGWKNGNLFGSASDMKPSSSRYLYSKVVKNAAEMEMKREGFCCDDANTKDLSLAESSVSHEDSHEDVLFTASSTHPLPLIAYTNGVRSFVFENGWPEQHSESLGEDLSDLQKIHYICKWGHLNIEEVYMALRICEGNFRECIALLLLRHKASPNERLVDFCERLVNANLFKAAIFPVLVAYFEQQSSMFYEAIHGFFRDLSSLESLPILLAGSYIGNYIMLPWCEEDSDICNNFWLSHTELEGSLDRSLPSLCVPSLKALHGHGTVLKRMRSLPLWSRSVVSPPLPTTFAFESLPDGVYEKTEATPVVGGSPVVPHGDGFEVSHITDIACLAQIVHSTRGKPYDDGAVASQRLKRRSEGRMGVGDKRAAVGLESMLSPLLLSLLNIDGWRHGKWTDPDGFMLLSSKQRQKFYAWRRLSDFLTDPVVILTRPSSRTIRQGFVGDCSFLSSLAVLAEYENRTNIPILSGLISPQGEAPLPGVPPYPSKSPLVTSKPLFNPTGMYGCRLYFNGVPRKVLIDDYVPIRGDGRILCAHSKDRREIWVTLLEKSFVKLMGGSYFMQGSNPGADLYHLTGWIPETIAFRSDIHTGSPGGWDPIVTDGAKGEDVYAAERSKWNHIWELLFNGLQRGDCLVCLGTSEVADAAPSGLDYPEGVSVSSGGMHSVDVLAVNRLLQMSVPLVRIRMGFALRIVARHAYSVLNFQHIGAHRLLYVKNPWGSVRWIGRFSPFDVDSWTAELCHHCRYNPQKASLQDNGCFWIPWEDVVRWFSHLYICWNNQRFPYEVECHSRWERSILLQESSLVDDSHVVAFNPQFHLQIDPTTATKAEIEVWILFTRHVKERKRDLSQRYLAMHMFSGNQRVACPPSPEKQGIYSNGECSLTKLVVGGNKPDSLKSFDYILMISQYSRKDEFSFTIKVYSEANVMLKELPPLFPLSWKSLYFRGAWTETTAGGCSNDMWSFFLNPQLRLILLEATEVVCFLECPLEHSVNFRIFKGPVATPRLLRTNKAISSGPYRAGCCYLRCFLEKGLYTIILSTFLANKIGEYQFCLHHPRVEKPPVIKPLPYPYAIPPLLDFFHEIVLCGTSNHLTTFIMVNVKAVTQVSFRLDCPGISFLGLPSLTLCSLEDCANLTLSTSNGQPFDEANSLVILQKSDLEGGLNRNGKPLSSAAMDLFKRKEIVTLSHAELLPKNNPYIIKVCSIWSEECVCSLKLHVISDNELQLLKVY